MLEHVWAHCRRQGGGTTKTPKLDAALSLVLLLCLCLRSTRRQARQFGRASLWVMPVCQPTDGGRDE